MIRAHRVGATAQEDASMIAGWNVAPNVAYILRLLPGTTSCGVLLYDTTDVLIATGAALAGTEQPCVLLPQTGQSINMVDADLGWHLLLTTTGTESQREIRVNPTVDLPDEIHPAYADDDMGLARATAAIDEAAHYRDDVTVSCPLGLGAGLGDRVNVPVDGAAVIGQVESVTWTGTPDGTSELVVIRRYVAIAPEAYVEPVLPTVADDAGTATHVVGTSGNVLANDDQGLVVTAVNGLSANVGVAVDGSNGGTFTIASTGTWTFDPDGDFASLTTGQTADTGVTYYASNGTAEAMATLIVTVSHANTAPVAVDDTGATDANSQTTGNVLINDTDAEGDSLTVSKVGGSANNVGVAIAGSGGGLFTIGSDGAWTFDPNGEFATLTGDLTATTSATYHVSDGMDEDEGTITITVSAAPAVGASFVGFASGVSGGGAFSVALPAGIEPGDMVIVIAAARSNVVVDLGVSTDGYTEVAALFANDSVRGGMSVNYKIMGSTPDVSVAVKSSGASYGQAVVIHVWRGVAGIDSFATAQISDTPTPTSPAVTLSAVGQPIISCVSSVRGSASGTFDTAADPVGFENEVIARNLYSLAGMASMMSESTATVGPWAWQNFVANNILSACAATLVLDLA